MEQTDATLIKSERLTSDICRLTLQADAIAAAAKPGQFVNIRCGQGFDPLLRRPFSIHQSHPDGTMQVVFKILGKGTTTLANLRPGQSVNLLGPLGNGFTIQESMCLVGGGLGIAPLLFLAQTIVAKNPQANLVVLLGSRHKDELTCLTDDFLRMGIKAHLATDDGSLGHHGLVTDLLAKVLATDTAWHICTCGPYPMMRSVAGICRQRQGWSCQVSLETMMACGISACLGCTVEANPERTKDGQYLHVCKEGPVFDEGDIKWR